MVKKLRFHIVLSVIAIAWIIYADSVKEKPINWFPSFSSQHKIPYGTYVLRNLLSDFLQGAPVKEVSNPPYVKLKDSTIVGTYFFVDNSINFDKEELNALLNFVDRGNDVFIATLGANVDTLNLETERVNTFNVKEKSSLQLVNPNLDTLPVLFNKDLVKLGFTSIDSLKTEVLGSVRIYDKDSIDSEEINFIRQKFGKGYFYFHLYPHAFTNYFMLQDSTRNYAASVLSYLDNKKPLLWDSYHKTGKSRISSPMNYILSSKNLKWAYYTALIGVLVFVLFQGKRNQRFIPVIQPLKNQTIAFTKTIANLYFEKKDHKAIAQKHIFHFLDFIRTELHIPTNVIDKTFYKNVSERTGSSLEEIIAIFTLISFIEKQQQQITKEIVIKIHTMIEICKSKYQSA